MNRTFLGAVFAAGVIGLLSIACGGASAKDEPSKSTPDVVLPVEATSTPAATTTIVPQASVGAPKDVILPASPAPGQVNPAQPASPPQNVIVPPTPIGPPTATTDPNGSLSSGQLPPCCKPTVAPPLENANSGPPPPLPAGTKAVPAPIDSLDVKTLESFPPQYHLSVKAGLPSGCAKRYYNSVSRNGNTFKVDVVNTLPAAEMVACTAIYGMYDLNLALPGTFVSGQTYTVQVNDKTTTFKAQ